MATLFKWVAAGIRFRSRSRPAFRTLSPVESAEIWIAKTGSTFPGLAQRRGDFEDWITAGMGLDRGDIRVLDVERGAKLPDPSVPAGVAVTGSSSMVSAREPWSERAAAWLADVVAAGTPVLGICYGHQLLAHALGGRVGSNPRGREIGTVVVELSEASRRDPLLGNLPERLVVQATHVEAVLELPPGARLLGGSALDPHHAFAVGTSAWGVQFHPEFDEDVMRTYLHERRELLREEGLDADALLDRTEESGHGGALLRRFVALVRGG